VIGTHGVVNQKSPSHGSLFQITTEWRTLIEPGDEHSKLQHPDPGPPPYVQRNGNIDLGRSDIAQVLFYPAVALAEDPSREIVPDRQRHSPSGTVEMILVCRRWCVISGLSPKERVHAGKTHELVSVVSTVESPLGSRWGAGVS